MATKKELLQVIDQCDKRVLDTTIYSDPQQARIAHLENALKRSYLAWASCNTSLVEARADALRLGRIAIAFSAAAIVEMLVIIYLK